MSQIDYGTLKIALFLNLLNQPLCCKHNSAHTNPDRSPCPSAVLPGYHALPNSEALPEQVVNRVTVLLPVQIRLQVVNNSQRFTKLQRVWFTVNKKGLYFR